MIWNIICWGNPKLQTTTPLSSKPSTQSSIRKGIKCMSGLKMSMFLKTGSKSWPNYLSSFAGKKSKTWSLPLKSSKWFKASFMKNKPGRKDLFKKKFLQKIKECLNQLMCHKSSSSLMIMLDWRKATQKHFHKMKVSTAINIQIIRLKLNLKDRR